MSDCCTNSTQLANAEAQLVGGVGGRPPRVTLFERDVTPEEQIKIKFVKIIDKQREFKQMTTRMKLVFRFIPRTQGERHPER